MVSLFRSDKNSYNISIQTFFNLTGLRYKILRYISKSGNLRYISLTLSN